MRTGFLLNLLWFAVVLIVAGCVPVTPAPQNVGMPNPAAVQCEEQGYTFEIRTDDAGNQYGVCIFPDGTECDAWAFYRGECGPGAEEPGPEAPAEVHQARDAVLSYLQENYSEVGLPDDLDWTVERISPEGVVGASSFRYMASDWTVAISYPIVAPADLVFDVTVTHQATGFQWVGTVDNEGNVTELETQIENGEPEGEAVNGWLGTIVKLPPGNQFGQYFERDDGEQYDVGASDEAVWDVIREARSTSARVKVWGALFTGVPASEARHIEVERIEIVAEPAGG